MAQPVWVLSVDLQAKTATFQTGMSDAARSARGAFDEIGGAAEGGGRRIGRGMTEARHSVMMLGEEFGVHIPRALASFIAGLGPIGAAMEAAFPFLAIILGATLLVEHLAKVHEAGEELTASQAKFGIVANNTFESLRTKLLEAQKRADELRGDHLGALNKELELIDRQSMEDLIKSFDELSKAADDVMKKLEGHWYTFGVGSDGANHALQQFKEQYETLLSKRTDAGKEEASNLLTGTLKTAQEVLRAQQVIKANRDSGGGPTDDSFAAEQTLIAHKASLTVTNDEIAAQQKLVDLLQSQAANEAEVNRLKAQDSKDARTSTGNAMGGQAAQAARQAADSQLRMGEQAIAADKATTDAQLEIHRASLEERLSSDIDFAGRERDVKLAANQADIAGLYKGGNDYQNQLKALNEKALEIANEYDTKVAELKAKTSVDVAARDLQQLEQSEREKIEATQQGSAARLTAINAAIKQEEAAHLQDTSFYRDLLNQRVEATRQEAEEESKLKAEAAREEASSQEKMDELRLSREKQADALANSMRRISEEQRIAQETQYSNEEYEIKERALQKEIEGLDKSGKDYLNKKKQLEDQEKQLEIAHANEVAAIREKAEIETDNRVMASFNRFNDSIVSGLTNVLMRHQSFTKMMISLGDQLVSGLIQNAIKEAEAAMIGKEADAAKAARKAYNIGVGIGGPIGMILGPVFGALAFATVTGYEGGTDSVPGVGRGDVVPAMLSPGEGIVPGGVMDGLSKMARSGGFDQGGPRNHVTMQVHWHGSALDADGMDTVLEKHADKLQRHVENTLRKMNH
jgi:hypothetical protein